MPPGSSCARCLLGVLFMLGNGCQKGVTITLLHDPIPVNIGTATIEPRNSEVGVGQRVRLTATIRGEVAGPEALVRWSAGTGATIEPLTCTEPGASRSCSADALGVAPGNTIVTFSVVLDPFGVRGVVAGAVVVVKL